jgi:Predicted pPIWI-associating nuclease
MSSTVYLEASKAEEVAHQLESQGYQVSIASSETDKGFELEATRGDETVAVQVKARSALKASLDEIRDRWRQARERGQEFRLVVVSPPREVRVQVEGMEDTLLDLLHDARPAGLDELPTDSRATTVTLVEIDTIEVLASGVRLIGSGVVEVDLESEASTGRDGLDLTTDFPFTFDIVLGHDLRIQQVNVIHVNTSSFDG